MPRSLLINTQPVTAAHGSLASALEAAASGGAHLAFARRASEVLVLPYRELLEQSARAAKSFLWHGLRRGDRVAVMLPTSPDWVVAFFGAILAGGIPVPLGATTTFSGIERYAATVRHVLVDCEALFLVATGPDDRVMQVLRREPVPNLLCLTPEVLRSGAALTRPLPSPDANALALLQYTSGTTGRPRGVMLSQRAILNNAFMIGHGLQMSDRDIGVSWLPLFHDMGLIGGLMTALYWKYPLTLTTPESFLIQPKQWLELVSSLRATLTVAPNFAYQLVCDRLTEAQVSKLDLSSLRAALNGSEMVRADTVSRFDEKFRAAGLAANRTLAVYGLAENSLAATFSPVGRDLRGGPHRAPGRATTVASVGSPLAATAICVHDQSGRELAPGTVGEVVIESASLMDGYFRNASATQLAFRDGWLRTGDVGYVEDGELYVTGRAKELIIKRGRNYYPDDVERLAQEAGLGAVRTAAAFSCSSDARGTEDVVLVLETMPLASHERSELEKRINAAVIDELGIGIDAFVFTIPRTIARTTSGKVQRGALRERFLAGAFAVERA